jgi:hypothetical protein
MPKYGTTIWKIGEGKPTLKFQWTQGAAFDLSSEGFDGPDGDRFQAFAVTLLWACCVNRGKSTPRQFAQMLPEDSPEDFQSVLISVLKESPWDAVGKAIEESLSEEEEGQVIGGDEAPGKPDTPSTETDSCESGQDSGSLVE